MKIKDMKTNSSKIVFLASLVILLSTMVFSQYPNNSIGRNKATNVKITNGLIEKKNVRSHMEFLASDAMQGRGSGTIFELIAGQYLASQMKQFGIEPAGDKKADGGHDFIQTVEISRNVFAEPPRVSFKQNDKNVSLTHGKEMVIWRLSAKKISGGLQILEKGEMPKKDSIALVKTGGKEFTRDKIGKLLNSGAAAVLIEETPQFRAGWKRFANRKISFSSFTKSTQKPSTALIIIDKASADEISKLGGGTKVEIGGKLAEAKTRKTRNAVGMIKGTDEKLSKEVILLSAHMDHIGVQENTSGDDKIFNGADDDASGCVAVLELARVLANGKRPKRTVYFAFFGSEESGGLGSKFFVNNLPFAKENIVANLQFEMLGRPDAKVGKDELWLTGYERSNLGSELAKQGANLVKDPHPAQNFFQRSDNYTLARQGIIAHTVSSFGLHKDYHQASDEIETIDFDYMTNSINSMVKPINWLVNSDFKPTWNDGMKP